MDKFGCLILGLVFIATAVCGQRDDIYEAQERAYYDYDVDVVDDGVDVSTNGLRRPPSIANARPFFVDDCKSRDRTRPHEKYCDHFYQLNGCSDSDNSAILRSCPNGLVYTGNGRNGLIGVCDYPHRANCNGRERINPPIETEHCDWLYGIFGHETSCTRYWTCWNGTATEQFCIGGLLYNEETHACDWPQNVEGCQKHPLCKDDANGNVPLGKSCNRYWACQGGYPRLQRCPAMLVFSRSRKRCVSPPSEDCDVPSTTTSSPDDSGFADGQNENSGPPQRSAVRQNNEGRRRFAGQQGGAGGPPPGLPFDLPQGAQPLLRPGN